MKPVVAWFAKNPVAANLLMAFLLIGGAMTATTIKMELFPEFSLDMIAVRVPYPGAAPSEVEEGICIKIEEEVHSIEGIKKVTSTASEGMGTIMVEVVAGEDPRRVLEDVKTRVDALENFPEEAEKPVIEELLMRRQVINVAIYGDADEVTLKRIGERVRDDINALDAVSQVELSAARPYEISIEVSESALRRYGLDFDAVANAVRASSLDLSGGSLKTTGGEILLRTKGQAYREAEFDEIVVMTRADGTRIHLRDVAQVIDGFEDTDQAAQFNGSPTVLVQVFRVGDESALEVSAAVKDYIERARPHLPEGVHMDPWQDNAVWLQSRLSLLLRNGAQGLALVFLVLALFLRFRLAFWVTMGIPISFLGVVLVMPGLDQSINMLSLFAFILVLGIVVDDAIVVGESIYSEQRKHGVGIESASHGAQRVAVPVIFAVLTTMVAFVPMMHLPGTLGKFFGVVPLVVIPALAFSLVESQLILPAHLAHGSALMRRCSLHLPFRWWVLGQAKIADGLERFTDRVYRPSLKIALRWRYATLAAAIVTLFVVAGLVKGKFVKFVFFPDIEGDIVAAQVVMPEGTSASVTEAAVRQLEEAASALRAELEERGEGGAIRHFMASVGEQPYLSMQRQNSGGSASFVGPQLGEVVIELARAEERDVTANELVGRWRELCGPVSGVVELNFDSAIMSTGKAIHFQLEGNDNEELASAAAELRAAIGDYQGALDVTDSFRGGKQELALDIRPAAEALGLTRRDLARQVRQGFHGEEAQRIQRQRDEVKVMVRYPLSDRRSLYGLESMRVRTPMGAEVPFSAVATAEVTRGYATIRRSDRQRIVDVTADVDSTLGQASAIIADLEANALPGILQSHPGVRYKLEGQSNEQAETVAAMSRYFIMALIIIYGLMAIPFRSYMQPLIVMSAIPFGFVGAVLGHLFMGLDLSMLSVMGMAALAGVVVNDSLVLVDFVNRRREEGLSVIEAARTAGVQRFRPVILTSITTFAGLTPLILERSVQAQFLIPMAVSLAFGVMFATLVTLVLVPSGYLILDDLARLPARLFGSRPVAEPDASQPV